MTQTDRPEVPRFDPATVRALIDDLRSKGRAPELNWRIFSVVWGHAYPWDSKGADAFLELGPLGDFSGNTLAARHLAERVTPGANTSEQEPLAIVEAVLLALLMQHGKKALEVGRQ